MHGKGEKNECARWLDAGSGGEITRCGLTYVFSSVCFASVARSWTADDLAAPYRRSCNAACSVDKL